MKRYMDMHLGEFAENNEGEWVKYSEALEAVKTEREACAMECNKISSGFAGVKWSLATTCAEAIRARG